MIVGQSCVMFRRHPILTLSTLAYLGVVAWLTLSPQAASSASNPLWRLARLFGRYEATDWITFNALEFGANVAMFVPIGVFLVLLLGRQQWWLATLVGVVLTVAIEYAQSFLPYRVTDTRDLIANGLGAVAGTLLALLLTARAARRTKVREGSRYQPAAAGRA